MLKRIMRWFGYMPIPSRSIPLDILKNHGCLCYSNPDARADDGAVHKLDPESIEAFDDDRCDDYGSVIIEAQCEHCGLTGQVELSPENFLWD